MRKLPFDLRHLKTQKKKRKANKKCPSRAQGKPRTDLTFKKPLNGLSEAFKGLEKAQACQKPFKGLFKRLFKGLFEAFKKLVKVALTAFEIPFQGL